jgi:hypothetical protein
MRASRTKVENHSTMSKASCLDPMSQQAPLPTPQPGPTRITSFLPGRCRSVVAMSPKPFRADKAGGSENKELGDSPLRPPGTRLCHARFLFRSVLRLRQVLGSEARVLILTAALFPAEWSLERRTRALDRTRISNRREMNRADACPTPLGEPGLDRRTRRGERARPMRPEPKRRP